MAKILLGHHNVEKYIDRAAKSIQIDGTVILPPGMKDYLQTEGISLMYVKTGDAKQAPASNNQEEIKQSVEQVDQQPEDAVGKLTSRIVSILKDEHRVTGEETIKRICLQVINQIKL